MISRLKPSANSPGGMAGGAALFLALSLVNVLNFVFHLVVARRLSSADYGALAAALGVLLIAFVPINAFQAVVTAEIAQRSTGRALLILRGLLARAWLVGLVVIALVASLAVPLTRFLHLGHPLVVVLIGFAVLPSVVALPGKAALLGTRRYRPVALAVASGAAVRLGVAWYFVGTGRGVVGGVAASVFGECTAAVVLLLAARRHFDARTAQSALTSSFRDAANAVAAFGGLWLLTGIDIMLARHYLPAETSGHYAAAATAGKIALFLPGIVTLVAFPCFARAPDERTARGHLTVALGAVAFVGLAAAGGLWVFADAIVGALFGDRYLASTAVVGVLALAGAGLGLVNVLVQYHVARRRRTALVVWAGPLLTAGGATVWHDSMGAMASWLLAGVTLSVAGLYAASRATRPVPVPVSGPLLDLDLDPAGIEVTIVVPFYNAGPQLRETVDRLCRVLEEQALTYEVIAVSDGSTDGSAASLEGVGETVLLISLPANVGKGQALRTGMAASRGRYLGFIDGDGDIDPGVLRPFLSIMRTYEPDVIVGTKRHPMSLVDYPPLRRVYSWGYQRLVHVLFRLNLRDTQTGLKLARRDVLAAVLPRMLEKRFAFDLELLVVASHLGYGRFFEAPVIIRRQFGSTVSWRAVRGMLLDTLAIFYRLRVLRFYDQPHRQVDTAPVAADLAPATT